MFLGELQRVDHAQHLVDVAPERQVVDHLMADDAVAVDQEGAAEGDAGGVEFDVVGATDFVLDVGDERIADLPDAALVHGRVLPRQMGEFRVDRHADDLDVARLEFGQAMVEGDQFGRTDEGEVERVEEEHDVLAARLCGEAELADLVVGGDRIGGEVGCGLAYEDGHRDSPLRWVWAGEGERCAANAGCIGERQRRASSGKMPIIPL